MAYQKPIDIDGYVTQMAKADMRVKAQLAEDLVLYLSDSENSIECTDLGLLIDGLIPWMTGSHHKVGCFIALSLPVCVSAPLSPPPLTPSLTVG